MKIERNTMIGIIVIMFAVIAAALVLPSYAEGSLGATKYNVDATVSMCGSFLGSPTTTLSFSPPQKTLFSVASAPYCIAGVCNIEVAKLKVTGPVYREVDLGGGWTLPIVGSCVTKTAKISGLTAGTYNVDVLVVEGGGQTKIKSETLVIQ